MGNRIFFILCCLLKDIKLFKELRHEIQKITQRILTTKLRELEKDKIIERKVYTYALYMSNISYRPFGELCYIYLAYLKKMQNFSY